METRSGFHHCALFTQPKILCVMNLLYCSILCFLPASLGLEVNWQFNLWAAGRMSHRQS